MIDIQYIRNNTEKYKQSLNNRQKSDLVDKVDVLLELDEKRRDLLQSIEQLRAKRNELSSKISGAEDKDLIKEAAEVKQQLQEIEPDYDEVLQQYYDLLLQMPNQVHPAVPIGKDENENVVVLQWGERPSFDFPVKDHVDLGELHDMIDIETSAIVSGSRFNYLKNEAVLLQFALIQFVLNTLSDKNLIGQIAEKVGNDYDTPFTPVLPPVILKADVAKKMDRFDPIEDRYYLAPDDALLVGSAEHTLGPMFIDQILDMADLPLRYIGYSTAFRREAGSYGKDTRGILRRHQFDKLEMETFSTKEQGEKEQDLIVSLQEYLVQQLEIPHQVVAICSGDMGGPDYRQIDIECFMPGQDKYRETHTSDYMTDYQARRLNTRYRLEDGSTEYVHMNDATAFAIGRILIAIMENYQQKDGSIKVPVKLQDYVGKKVIKQG